MTREQLDLIPDRLLSAADTRGLLKWLDARGLSMSLLELGAERQARGIQNAHK